MIRIEPTLKADERALLLAVSRIERDESGHRKEMPRDVAKRLGIHPKRAGYLFLKWSRKGWADYGVSADTCWLERDGLEVARILTECAGEPGADI